MVSLKIMVELDVVGVSPLAWLNLDLLSIEGMVSDGVVIIHVLVSRGVYVIMMSTVKTGRA